MTQRTVPDTRPAPQRRPGVRDGSSWHAPAALVVLSLIPLVARPRRRRPGWHRRSGQILIAAGLLVAGSGLCMTPFCPGAPVGDLLSAYAGGGPVRTRPASAGS